MDYIMSQQLEDFIKDKVIEKKFSEINKIENKSKDEMLILKIKYINNLLPDNAIELRYFNGNTDIDILEKRNFILKKIEYSTKSKAFINDFRQVLDTLQLLNIFLERNVSEEILYQQLSQLSIPNTKNINTFKSTINNLMVKCDENYQNGLLSKIDYETMKEVVENVSNDMNKMDDYKKNKTKLEMIKRRMFSRINDEENQPKIKAFVDNVSSTLDVFYQIEQYNDFTKKASSKVHFSPKSFGTLSEDILISNFSTFDLEKYDVSKSTKNESIIKEIISFSQKYNNMPDDFTKNHSNVINFTSNTLHILIKEDLDKLSEKELIALHKDLQEIIVSYVYVFNTIKTQYNLNNNDLFKILSGGNQEVLSNMIKLSLSPSFSKEYDVSKIEVLEIKKTILESVTKFKNISSHTNDFINSKREDNAVMFNKEYMNFDLLSKDPKFYLSNVTSSIGDKMLNLNYFNPLMNIFKFWTNFILNYNQNIYMEKYNRPTFIFNKNLKDISNFIKELENAINTGNVNKFIEKNIEWTGESLGKKITVSPVTFYRNSIKDKSKNVEKDNFDFNNFM